MLDRLNPKNWSDATRRAVRTLLHGSIALITALPIVLAELKHLVGDNMSAGMTSAMATVVLWSAGVSRILNALEDSGVIKGWLKTSVPSVEDPIDPQPVDPSGDVTDAPVDGTSDTVDTVGDALGTDGGPDPAP